MKSGKRRPPLSRPERSAPTVEESDDFSVDIWAARALESLELPDERLKARAVQSLVTLARKPTDSIPQACGGWASTKATYRFFASERVTATALRDAARASTARSCRSQAVILAPQDSTSFSMPSARQTQGLGQVGSCDVRGFYLHSMLLLDETGVPLGLAGQYPWAREQVREITPAQRKRLPIEEKESFKWFILTRQIRESLEAMAQWTERPYVIHIFDREGDIHEVFAELCSHVQEGFVIRSTQNRAALDRNGVAGKAHSLVGGGPVLGTHTLDVPRKKKQPARKATLEIRACQLSLSPRCSLHPERRRAAPLELGLVEAREINCPEGCEPLRWMLWTREPASTLAQCLRVVMIYTHRWKIEDYHLTLKSGCGMEKLRLKSLGAFEKVLLLYGLISVRIMRLRDTSRATPEDPCTKVLSNVEWRVLQTHVTKTAPSPVDPPPTLRQAVLWIGRLGGHLGRKGDGMPGVRVLWKGLRDLDLLVHGARVLLRNVDSLSGLF